LKRTLARGLTGVHLVTSDADRGLVDAIAATLPGACWQRCRTHYVRDLLTQVPKSQGRWVATMVRTVFDQPDAGEVHVQFDRVVTALEAKLTKAGEHLGAAREQLLAFTCSRGSAGRRSGATTRRSA
jgi:putative transposase